MAEQKTKPSGEDVGEFLNRIEDEERRQDSLALLELIGEVTQAAPKIWAASMVGFGETHYQYASGHSGDTFVVGFAPRKQHLVLYGLLAPDREDILGKLGKFKAGKGCLYVKRLADLDLPTLRGLVRESFEHKLKNDS